MLDVDKVVAAIEGWDRVRVLVIGDVMLDEYIFGDVTRLSPEAPVPVVKEQRREYRLGGAANVALNLKQLGAQVTLVGAVGLDKEGDVLMHMLSSAGIVPELIRVVNLGTTCKTRVLGMGHQIVRLDRDGVCPHLEPSQLGEWADFDIVVLSDYNKGVLDDYVCQKVIQGCRKIGIPVLVDPKGPGFDKYAGAMAMLPNLKEYCAMLGEFYAKPKLEPLLKGYDLCYIGVTLAEEGITVIEHDGVSDYPACAKEVFDVSGAGDTVTAVFTLCHASGIPPKEAAQLANLAAGVVVGKIGTVAIVKGELTSALVKTWANPA